MMKNSISPIEKDEMHLQFFLKVKSIFTLFCLSKAKHQMKSNVPLNQVLKHSEQKLPKRVQNRIKSALLGTGLPTHLSLLPAPRRVAVRQ